MADGLTRLQIKTSLDKLTASLSGEDCHTCECTQAYIVQLEIDAVEDVADLLEPLKVPRDDMHPCNGCKPCPPGSLCARYYSGDDFCDDGCDCD